MDLVVELEKHAKELRDLMLHETDYTDYLKLHDAYIQTIELLAKINFQAL